MAYTLVASIGSARVFLDVDTRDNVLGAMVENDGPGPVSVEVFRPVGAVFVQSVPAGTWSTALPGAQRFKHAATTADWGVRLTPIRS